MRVVRVDEFYLDPEGGENVAELRVGAAVEVAGADNIVASRSKVDDRIENAGRSRGDSQPAHFGRTFEQGYTLFQHVGRGVHQPGVNVAQLFEGEEIRGVLSAFENERAGPINGHRARESGRVWLLSSVEADGVESHDFLVC